MLLLLDTHCIFSFLSEQGLRQMAVLKISEHHGAEGQHVTELAKNCQRPLTLSELFIMGPGRKARSLLTSDTRDQVSC
jgi:hypothetical protein